ncbi:MAG: hydroxyisourate hydrolase [Bradymonadaceae bacterium]
MKSPITTHVLDTAQGRPAAGVTVTLALQTAPDQWSEIGRGVTDEDGRITDLLPSTQPAEEGTYRLTFKVDDYFAATRVTGFYSTIPIIFELRDPTAHYHVPLLLNPFGYSTYRGS